MPHAIARRIAILLPGIDLNIHVLAPAFTKVGTFNKIYWTPLSPCWDFLFPPPTLLWEWELPGVQSVKHLGESICQVEFSLPEMPSLSHG